MSASESLVEQLPSFSSTNSVGTRSNSLVSSSMYSDSKADHDRPRTLLRAHTENISSVTDNPFYKNFGRKHHIPPVQSKTNSESEVVLRKKERRASASSKLERDDDDDIGEYRPGSGFVHKLLDKFTSMSSREPMPIPEQMKRSTSLEDLSADSHTAKSNSASMKSKTNAADDVANKPSHSITSKLSYTQRAKSIESLNHVHRKHHSHSHSRPHLAVNLRHVEQKKKAHPKQPLSPRSPRDSHPVAPDVDLARDDIIIIETTPSVPEPKEESGNDSESESDNGFLSYREDRPPEELPKPNTVLNVRSIFETASAATAASILRNKFDLKKVKQENATVTSPKASDVFPDFKKELAKRSSSSSEQDNDLTSPLLTANTPRLSDQQSGPPSFSSMTNEEKKSSQLNAAAPFSSLEVSTPRSDTSESSDVSNTSSVLERRGKFDSPRLLGVRPTPSPRNTASVKPTPASGKPSAPVKPLPLNIPASTTTSYRKSSPVVPVAPYKDNKDDSKDDGQPVMIFDSSKLSSSSKSKPKRIRNYEPINDTEKSTSINNKDLIIPKDSDSITKSDFNKGLVQNGKPSTDAETAENITDKPNIIQTEQKTVIELRSTADANTKSAKQGESKFGLTDLTKPAKISRRMAPSPPQIIQNNVSAKVEEQPQPVPSFRFSNAKRLENAAEESKPTVVPPKLERQKPTVEPPKLETESKPKGQMIYVSSSESSESDSTPPVTPRRSGSEENDTSQPIKGIPSIIADRLRKQNSHPSAVSEPVTSNLIAESLTKSSSNTDLETTSNGGIVIAAETKTPDKEAVSNEIENEIAAVRKKMEGNRSKPSGVAQIFDSSQLAKKRKENQRRRQAAQAAQGIVPPLDLSGIDDRKEYMRPVPQEIKPCNITFIGENAATSRSLLKKQRAVKVNIHFNDTKTETFNYPSEEEALEHYLQDHPHEAANILVLEDFGGENGESSDDTETVDVYETPVTPRGNNDDDLLKSNTALSHSGSLQSYKSKYQEEFQFGSSFDKPEPAPVVVKEEPKDDPDSLMLRPAEETDSNIWSTNDSSDLLF